MGLGEKILPTKEQCETPEYAGIDLQDSIKSVFDQIKSGQLKAMTPILTNVCSRNNMVYIRAENVKLLQKFAEEMKGNEDMETLKTRPVNLKVAQIRPSAGDGLLPKKEQTDYLNCEVVVKVFLNGTKSKIDRSVSVCVSVVNRDGDRWNVLEGRKLIVSIYLKYPSGNKPYRKDFKMDFSPELEKGEKGLLEFISKENIENYITDGAITFGVAIRSGSSASTKERLLSNMQN